VHPNPQAPAVTANALPVFWRAPWDFAVHTIVGTTIFAIIAAPAIGLGMVVNKLEGTGTDGVIFFGLKTAEYALFATDLGLYLVFLWRTAKRAVKRL